jgi:hypothetical protein
MTYPIDEHLSKLSTFKNSRGCSLKGGFTVSAKIKTYTVSTNMLID